MGRSVPVRAALPQLAAIVLTFAALTTASATAQNLIGNPELDSDDSGWYHDTSLSQQWDSEDSDLCSDSGSLTAMALTTSPEFQAYSTRPMDCVAVSADEIVHLSIRVRLDASDVIARIYLTYCADSGCVNCGSFSPYLDYDTPSAGVWTTLAASHAIPSAGVAAVYFTINASEAAATPFTIDLDRAYLGRTDFVYQDDFEIGEACRWSFP